jgi:glutaconate CoA-transferase subunit B
VIVIARHSPRTFVEELDFVTSLGHQRGHTVVITDLGVLRPSDDGELQLVALHPDVEPDQVQEATGWDLRVAPELDRTQPVTEQELGELRDLRASARR